HVDLREAAVHGPHDATLAVCGRGGFGQRMFLVTTSRWLTSTSSPARISYDTTCSTEWPPERARPDTTSSSVPSTTGISATARKPSSTPGEERLSSRRRSPESQTHTSSTLTNRQR